MTPILFTNSHAIYSIGFISNEAWDEESQSYAVDVENELVTSLAQLFARGYTVSVKATIESSDGTTETVFTAKKVERQETPDGNVVYITFDNGATLTDTLFTISYAESGGGGGAGVFLITENVTLEAYGKKHTLNKTYREIVQAYNAGKLCIITSLLVDEGSDSRQETSEYVGGIVEEHVMIDGDRRIFYSVRSTSYLQYATESTDGYPYYMQSH